MRSLFVFIVALIYFVNLGHSQDISVQSEEGYEILTSRRAVRVESAEGYSVANLPNPKERGQNYFVANPDGILRSSTVEELNILAQKIENITKAEYAIVVVDDYEGNNDFEFALDLFNTWGIGKSESNNGLLLFIAKKRHEYRFISGYGMESILSDALLKRIGETYLVPNFRNEDYDLGIIEASNFIARVLESPDSIKDLDRQLSSPSYFWNLSNPILLNSVSILILFIGLYSYNHLVSRSIVKQNKPKPFVPVFQGLGCMGLLLFFSVFIFLIAFDTIEDVYQLKNLPYFVVVLSSFILAMKITEGRRKIEKEFQDAEERDRAFERYIRMLMIPMLITPLAWIDLFLISKTLFNNRGRYVAPDDSGDWQRVIRRRPKIDDKGLLDQGQRNEERIGSRKYEIWKNRRSGKILLLPWEIKSKYKTCTKCGYYTLELDIKKIVREPTYSSYGEGEVFDKCYNCSYRLFKRVFRISQKRRSSSSGSGSSYSGGSSSSSSGSFGGGSSGGGGAGGRW